MRWSLTRAGMDSYGTVSVLPRSGQEQPGTFLGAFHSPREHEHETDTKMGQLALPSEAAPGTMISQGAPSDS